MKKNKKIIISAVISIITVLLGIFVYYKFFYDANALSLTEKEWLNKHKNIITTINVSNDINIFSKSGKGVFFDFLKDFEENNEIKINKNVVNPRENNDLGFSISKNIDNNDLLLYKDHFVIVSKDYQSINKVNDLVGKNIGVLANDINRFIENYNVSLTFTTVNNKDELLNNLKEDKVNYIMVSLNEYLNEILLNNYNVIYHLDDLSNYYYIKLGSDSVLNSIIKKYYNKWYSNKYTDSLNKNIYDLFVEDLQLSQLDIDSITNKTYSYGFVNSTPYQTLSSSKYGGKIISYLESFAKINDIDFTYTKYKNYNELVKAYEKGKVDLLFDNTSFNINGINIRSNIVNNYVIISPLLSNLKVSNLNDLNNSDVYVVKDSKLALILNNYKNINIKLVNNEKDLLNEINKNNLVALDSLAFDYFKNYKIKNYQIAYTGNSDNYNFVYKNGNDSFSKLFSAYIKYVSDYEMTNNGLLTYYKTESNGNMIGNVAKYVLLVIGVTIVIISLVIASRKNIKIKSGKIKKDEKLKFIDMLTSLKNRNYLNERINFWNQNTIYPQSIIIIDLNNIKYLNDTFGHEEGDKQIMSAANVLHQMQLDNTEIMRTDGNEFMIYMVGYTEKQVVNYIKKLIKEFNSLPYEYGAAFGFSMIVDDLKLIDDAINEATIQMRENKELESEKNES